MIDTCRPALVSLVARWPLGDGCRMHIALWHDRVVVACQGGLGMLGRPSLLSKYPWELELQERQMKWEEAEQRSGDELEVPVVSLGLSQRQPPPRVTAASGWMSANNRFPSLEEGIDGIDKRSTDWGVCPCVSGGVCQPGMVGLATTTTTTTTTTASGSYKGKQEQPEELFHPVSFLDSRTVGACVRPSIHTNFPSWMRKAHGDTPITHETAVRQTTSYSRQSVSAEWDDGYLSCPGSAAVVSDDNYDTIDNNNTPSFASENPIFVFSLIIILLRLSIITRADPTGQEHTLSPQSTINHQPPKQASKQSLNQEPFLGNPCDSRQNRNRYPCLIHPYSNGVNSGVRYYYLNLTSIPTTTNPQPQTTPHKTKTRQETKERKKDVRLPPRQQRRIHGRIGPLHPRPPTRAILPRHETISTYNHLNEDPSNLLDIYRTTKPPYFWHHIRPERQRWGINEIARNASPLTRPLFARGMTSGEYGPNWVAGWLLYSVFRSRDVRNNRNRRLLKDKNGNGGGISGGSGEGRASSPQMVLRYDGGASAAASAAGGSGKKEYYDPVRNG
ncbi:uncharacterized protein BO96DRAFT_431426 [Aspergillus niger CBS 101883]|uniref:uncharacterized protein n=1 Tax=Aspergillus lacticoffeatus (strain CBS 101883) TaxID=1450533 RepID=UPI000D803633|nr:uncharacterized protein BO96DRAFT_431426 [Aspergillus niger CBS 101883]PYH59265.1 hypothetical protein BO96DRAFT_431426 [Aspergillus niger CBS 101883]